MKICSANLFFLLIWVCTTAKSKVEDFVYDLSVIEPFDPHATSGISKFTKDMHHKKIDYFQIKVEVTVDKNNLDLLLENMSTYFQKWFAVDPDNETIVVNYMKGPSGQKIKNRFKILYANNLEEINKTYYIDVNYQDGKESDTPYKDQSIAVPLDEEAMEDPWKKKFMYTLDTECNFIKSYFDAKEGNCSNVVSSENYVIPNVYDVNYIDQKDQSQKQRVIVQSQNEMSEVGQPEQTESGLIIDTDVRNNIRQKIITDVKDSAVNIPDEYKDSLIAKPQIKSQINNLVTEIQKGGEMVEQLMKQSEREYQEALRKQLFITKMEKISSYDDHYKTLHLMQEKSDEINAYNIELQIKRTLRKANYLHNYKIHQEKEKYTIQEFEYDQLQRKLMDMEYVLDELRDKHYRKMTKIKASQ